MVSLSSLYNWLLINSVILLNTVFNLIERVCDTADIAVKAVKDSNIPDSLVFRNRNECPWRLKENSGYVLKGVSLCYSVNERKFYDLPGTVSPVKRMDDIILADLIDISGNSICDMSEFLHSLRWTDSASPSLYELVLVNTLLNKIVASHEYLQGCTLKVMTLTTNPSLKIKLSSEKVKEPFTSWDDFEMKKGA
jgi:hypothetical protein